MNRSFKFTQINSTPFAGLNSTVIIGDGTDSNYHLLIQGADGLGAPQFTPQTQQAPFQQGVSPIRNLYPPRLITINAVITIPARTATQVAAINTIKRNLGMAVSPVGMGFVQNTSLSYSTYGTYLGQLAFAQDGITYDRFIDVIPLAVNTPNRTFQEVFQKVQFIFFCPDPFWYGATQSTTFTAVPALSSNLAIIKDAAFSPTLGIAVCIGTASGGGTTYRGTSNDGIVWDNVNSTSSWWTICWDPVRAIFAAYDFGSGSKYISTDGVSWDAGTVTNLGGTPAKVRVSSTGQYLAHISGTVVKVSNDGITWTSGTLTTSVTNADFAWSSDLSMWCLVGQVSTSGDIETSTDGITWTSRVSATEIVYAVVWNHERYTFQALGNTKSYQSSNGTSWSTLSNGTPGKTLIWNGLLGLYVVAGSANVYSSPDGVVWTNRLNVVGTYFYTGWFNPKTGAFVLLQGSGGTATPYLSYDGINWMSLSTSDYYCVVNSAGAVPTDFTITVPLPGGETGKILVITDGFLYNGSGTPPSDHVLAISTNNILAGNLVITTKFGSKSIVQNYTSFISNVLSGVFFSLYPNALNYLYAKSTGAIAAAPTITWKNKYLAV